MKEFSMPAEIIDFTTARSRFAASFETAKPNVSQKTADIISFDDFRKQTFLRENQSESYIPVFAWPEYKAVCRETLAGIEARIEKTLKDDEGTEIRLCSIIPGQQTCFALDESGAETEQAILLRDFLDVLFVQMISYGLDKGLKSSDKENASSDNIPLAYTSATYPLQFISRVYFINEEEKRVEWFVRKDKPLQELRRIK